MEASRIDAFAEAEALVDEFGARPPGSRMPSGGLLSILRGNWRSLGGRFISRGFRCGRSGPPVYAINAGLAVVGGVLAVYAAALGTVVVLVAVILTFLDASGSRPPRAGCSGGGRRRTSSPSASARMEGALVLVAHYDSGPTRTWPLRHMFIAMAVLLACSRRPRWEA